MQENNRDEILSFDDHDEVINPKPDTCEFDDVVERAMSRRGFLGAGLVMSTAAFLASTSLLTPSSARANDRFPFKAVEANGLDTITVPEGYEWQPVMSWGDPLWSKGEEFNPETRGTTESQLLALGDNNDGMELFADEDRNIFVVNNEYTNLNIMYGNRENGVPANKADAEKGMAAHGVSVVEIKENDGKWAIVKDSPVNRRITAKTPMEITGPAKGHELMKTAADPAGAESLGTWNNCGSGTTPWGTYLACEENFNGYYSSTDEAYEPTDAMKRYGISNKDWGYAWGKYDERFDISKNPNEVNRSGYVVEIDPRDPNSTPKKRTALGRFKHENAEVVVADNGQVVVYMGDDERGEFLYRFVSDHKFVKDGDNSKVLEEGSLYAAKFHDDGKGEWLPLTPKTTGMSSLADICIHTRISASNAGATTMDRPEWVTLNPNKAEVYVSLTNNKNRGKKTNAGGDETPIGGPNPREANKYGQIVRWLPENGDHTAQDFEWNLFVLAGNPTVHKDAYAGSENVNSGNMFNSPDGIAFDSKGMLWIQTDGKYSNKGDFAGMGNNQMLVGDPETGEIRRFLVGPKEAEITGICWSADRKTAFVGVQHPGEKGDSNFPAGGNSIPRSTVVAVRRQDGAEIG